jgi:hypothetical protein
VKRPLPPPLPAAPPDERLVASIATETGVPCEQVARWLRDGTAPGHLLPALREALWRPLGGLQ